jgi:hypothetical protein
VDFDTTTLWCAKGFDRRLYVIQATPHALKLDDTAGYSKHTPDTGASPSAVLSPTTEAGVSTICLHATVLQSNQSCIHGPWLMMSLLE